MTARALRLVLGDQLSRNIASLSDLAPGDLVLLAEVAAEAGYVRHHKKKLVLVFAAMRHFARALEAEGIAVRYVRLDDPGNTGAIDTEVERTLAEAGPFDRVVMTKCGEWRPLDVQKKLSQRLSVPCDLREDDRFLSSLDRFFAWAEGRKSLRMEFFYREMRRSTGLLMDGDAPVGGEWNYDAENRKALPKGHRPPARLRFEPDAITREVIDLVAARFGNNFGDLEPFEWAVTATDAQRALDHFIADCLPTFGDYQDAMAPGEPFLHHSLISMYLNLGLLDPLTACRAAEAAYRRGAAPLNAAEGFIRQILGWREYVRGVYWLNMPGYTALNALEADRPLPDFYWTGETKMACVRDCVETTRKHAYAHHIQRLMITGNFALLAGVHPDHVEDWYLVVYADAYEWVESPNTRGMALYADGGIMASKPYAASGAYIDRMSSYCSGCAYDVKAKSGPRACPFNYLYWDFLMRNEPRLARNPRMAMPYRTLAKMDLPKRSQIRQDADRFLGEIGLLVPAVVPETTP